MKQQSQTISLETKRQFEILDITPRIQKIVAESGITNGICLVFCPHTTASIRINHNESLLMQDFMKALYRLIPVDASYGHDLFELRQKAAANERSNGHAHVKAFIMGSSESLIIQAGQPQLGAKQSVFFVEFDGGRARQIFLQIMGE